MSCSTSSRRPSAPVAFSRSGESCRYPTSSRSDVSKLIDCILNLLSHFLEVADVLIVRAVALQFAIAYGPTRDLFGFALRNLEHVFHPVEYLHFSPPSFVRLSAVGSPLNTRELFAFESDFVSRSV